MQATEHRSFEKPDEVREFPNGRAEIVKAGGGNKDSIMRCGIFLSDLADFTNMDGAYRKFFGQSLPSRTTVQAGLGSYKVEIDAIAVRVRKSNRPTKK